MKKIMNTLCIGLAVIVMVNSFPLKNNKMIEVRAEGAADFVIKVTEENNKVYLKDEDDKTVNRKKMSIPITSELEFIGSGIANMALTASNNEYISIGENHFGRIYVYPKYNGAGKNVKISITGNSAYNNKKFTISMTIKLKKYKEDNSVVDIAYKNRGVWEYQNKARASSIGFYSYTATGDTGMWVVYPKPSSGVDAGVIYYRFKKGKMIEDESLSFKSYTFYSNYDVYASKIKKKDRLKKIFKGHARMVKKGKRGNESKNFD